MGKRAATWKPGPDRRPARWCEMLRGGKEERKKLLILLSRSQAIYLKARLLLRHPRRRFFQSFLPFFSDFKTPVCKASLLRNYSLQGTQCIVEYCKKGTRTSPRVVKHTEGFSRSTLVIVSALMDGCTCVVLNLPRTSLKKVQMKVSTLLEWGGTLWDSAQHQDCAHVAKVDCNFPHGSNVPSRSFPENSRRFACNSLWIFRCTLYHRFHFSFSCSVLSYQARSHNGDNGRVWEAFSLPTVLLYY